MREFHCMLSCYQIYPHILKTTIKTTFCRTFQMNGQTKKQKDEKTDQFLVPSSNTYYNGLEHFTLI